MQRTVRLLPFPFAAWSLLAGCGERPAQSQEKAVADAFGEPDLDVNRLIFERYEKRGFEGLTEAERTAHCVWWLEAEVNNGGFDQFYFNSAGDHAVETVAALERIGARHTAGIVTRANAAFRDGRPPRERAARQKQLLALSKVAKEELGELDDEFYEYRDDLKGLLDRFVQEHRADIGGR